MINIFQSFSCLPLADSTLEELYKGRLSLLSAITKVEKAQITMDPKWRVKKWKNIKHSKLGDLVLDGLVLVSRKGAATKCHAFLFRNILLLCMRTAPEDYGRSRHHKGRKLLKFLARIIRSPVHTRNIISDRSLYLKGGIHLNSIQ